MSQRRVFLLLLDQSSCSFFFFFPEAFSFSLALSPSSLLLDLAKLLVVLQVQRQYFVPPPKVFVTMLEIKN